MVKKSEGFWLIPMIRDSDKNNVAEYLFEDLMASKMLRQQLNRAEQPQQQGERLTADEFHILHSGIMGRLTAVG